MTNQQLTEFFAYTGLTFSTDPEDLRVLKKQLLLELKSLGNDTITIGSRAYSKNDLINLFDDNEGAGVAAPVSTEALLSEFPLLRKVLHPEKIFLFIKFPQAARKHPDFDYFCQHEAQPRFNDFLQRIQATLKEDKLEAAAGLAVFLELFTDEQRYKAETNVKIMLRNKFEIMKKLPVLDGLMKKYFLNAAYYELVKLVAANDDDFLFEQLRVAESKNGKNSVVSTMITLYTFQSKLPFADDILDHINKNLEQLKKQRISSEARNPGSSSSSSEASPFRIVWIVLVVMLFMVRICMRIGHDSNPPTPVDWRQYQLPEEYRQQPDTIYSKPGSDENAFENPGAEEYIVTPPPPAEPADPVVVPDTGNIRPVE